VQEVNIRIRNLYVVIIFLHWDGEYFFKVKLVNLFKW